MARKKTDRQVDQMRAVVPAFTQEEIYLIHRALEMQAVVTDQIDRSYPDPAKRAEADLARELAETFRRANTARDYLEGK